MDDFFTAKMIADSVGPNGVRLSTMEVTTWRSVLAEFNTHKLFSRNAASNRAIPAHKTMAQILERPFVPSFRYNQPGMVPGDYVSIEEQAQAEALWLRARDAVLPIIEELTDKNGLNIHKQWPNRLLEAFQQTTILVTSTHWQNFKNLRVHEHATDEMRETGVAMWECLNNSTPVNLEYGDWHIPYVDIRTQQVIGNKEGSLMVSAGRCAAVSYDNLGQGVDIDKDHARGLSLLKNGHMSPFEHQAKCLEDDCPDLDCMLFRADDPDMESKNGWSGNLQGWLQFRKTLKGEFIFGEA